MPAARPLSLKGRALRYLAGRDYTRAELARKLASRPPDELLPAPTTADIERVLDELQAKGFLSDSRAAEALLRRRGARLGGTRVLGELRQKGVPDELLASVAQQLRETEQARAQAVWQKKFGTPAQTPAERLKQLRFMAARGFSAEMARRVVAGAADDDAQV